MQKGKTVCVQISSLRLLARQLFLIQHWARHSRVFGRKQDEVKKWENVCLSSGMLLPVVW
jgi:hypothetical protein